MKRPNQEALISNVAPQSPWKEAGTVGLLIVLHLALLAPLAHQVAWTIDEPAYLLGGHALVRDGFRWGTVVECFHGPLPLLANQLFTGQIDPSNLDPARFASRMGMLPFSVLLLLALWAWSREAWGRHGALLSLAAASLCIPLLAYGPLLGADTCLAAFTTLTLWLLWRWLRTPSLPGLLLWGASAGLMSATKYLAFLLLPALPLILLLATLRGATPAPWRLRQRPRPLARRLSLAALSLLAAAALGLVALHAAYLFRPGGFSPEIHALQSETGRALARLAGPVLRLLPAPMVLGLDFQFGMEATCRSVFLDFDRAHWAYYLVALGTKTPLPHLLLFCLVLILPRRTSAPRHLLLCSLLPAGLLLAYLSLLTPKQIGLRYVLPLYPLLCLLLGAWPHRRGTATPAGRLLLAGLALWAALGVLLAWPHYLGDFNALAGGPRQGHRLFADSNVDWGQHQRSGLEILRGRHPDLIVVGPFDGPRFGTLAAYTPNLKPPDPQRPGRTYHWLTRFDPVDSVAAAWLLYRVTPKTFEARRDDRASLELAVAWLGAGDPARARHALSAAPPMPRTALLERLLKLLERPAPLEDPERREALLLFAGFGRLDQALALFQETGGKEGELAFLLAANQRQPEALALLDRLATETQLSHQEAFLLARLRYEAGSFEAALEVLAAKEPPADPAFARLWLEMEEHLRELNQARGRLLPGR